MSTIIPSPEVKGKRGRRSKKEIADALLSNIQQTPPPKQPKKEKNKQVQLVIVSPTPENVADLTLNPSIVDNDQSDSEKPVAKKRGRKPKGGKIIPNITAVDNHIEPPPNIILHLKCSTKDLENTMDYTSSFNTKIESYDFNSAKNDLLYEVVNNEQPPPNTYTYNPDQHNGIFNNSDTVCDNSVIHGAVQAHVPGNQVSDDLKNIWRKLKILEHDLNINNIKKSACFWCSYDFDNPPIYIPKFFFKDSYHVYGCFCSPECATAHLMDENIDSSVKFERYYLINHIYSKIYEYKKNIKPAPNPYYMLDKYYGNLTIQEYRALFKSERLFLIVDKPLTRILPEFHEDNDEFIINNKIIPSNNFQVKKRIQQKGAAQTKNMGGNEKFCIM
jgi:hypothetical protein